MTTLGDTLVLGMGRSGVAAVRYLATLISAGEATSVTMVDSSDTPALREAATELRALGVNVLLGCERVEGRFGLCVASPGIPPHAELMVSAKCAAEKVVSEIEFAFARSDHTWVAITGTNGKTTTTALVVHLLQAAGMPARAVGNIGSPAITAVADTPVEEVLVAEVSSFQLALTETFRPRVAVLLNITPDHVNWHGSLEAYVADKVKVFANLAEGDVAVIDCDDLGSAPYADQVAARGVDVVRVSRDQAFPDGASVSDGWLTLETRGGAIKLVRTSDLLIRGDHNISNALAAAAAVHSLGMAPSSIAEGLRTFEPIEHRLEPVGTYGGVRWFNDSKATNPDAVFKALSAFGDEPLIVLLGGRNKGNDFRPLAEDTAARAKAAVLFGESAGEFEAAFEGLDIARYRADGLESAVRIASEIAVPGDSVVLSPACASFDEFSDYEARGRAFKQWVSQLETGVTR
jgi:UDP-N-acetylmuramoylalanine--D-glutamate ligase